MAAVNTQPIYGEINLGSTLRTARSRNIKNTEVLTNFPITSVFAAYKSPLKTKFDGNELTHFSSEKPNPII